MSSGSNGIDLSKTTIPAESFREMVERAADVIALLDNSASIVYANPAAEALFGYSQADLLGKSVTDFLHPEDQELAISAFTSLMGDLDHDRILLRFLDKAGTWRRVEVLGTPCALGDTSGMVLNVRDVTGKQALVEQIERSEALFRAAFNASGSICCISVLDTGEFIDVNGAWTKATGWSREEAVGKSAIALNIWGAPENRDIVIDAIRERGRLQQFRAVITTKSGENRSLLIDADVVQVDGESRMFITATDITEREMMELQLRQSQRMEAVGQLTGGVAHDFNNMLTVILGHIGLARQLDDQPESIQRSLQAIEDAAERGAELIEQLMIFSRRQTLHPRITKIADTLAKIEKLLAGTLGGEVRIIVDSTVAPNARCNLDAGLLENALLNLALNARDALGEGGTLTLRLAECQLPEDMPDLQLDPGPYVCLQVIDDGEGMDPETAARAFEPFFTTKPAGRGTGLGLSMVFGFVKQSGGHITIASARGTGTTVSIFLPQTTEPEPSIVAPVQLGQDLSGKRILLVEDNPDLRKMLAQLLTSLGCEVAESDGDNIDEVLADQHLPFDILLSDVILPGALRGPEVAHRTQAKFPGVRVLFMSGYPRDRLSSETIVDEQNLLAKPFSQRELLDRLIALIGAAPGDKATPGN